MGAKTRPAGCLAPCTETLPRPAPPGSPSCAASPRSSPVSAPPAHRGSSSSRTSTWRCPPWLRCAGATDPDRCRHQLPRGGPTARALLVLQTSPLTLDSVPAARESSPAGGSPRCARAPCGSPAGAGPSARSSGAPQPRAVGRRRPRRQRSPPPVPARGSGSPGPRSRPSACGCPRPGPGHGGSAVCPGRAAARGTGPPAGGTPCRARTPVGSACGPGPACTRGRGAVPPEARQPARIAPTKASTTYCSSARLRPGKTGSARVWRAAASATGKSPSTWPRSLKHSCWCRPSG